jgi:hypothetical protein
MPEPERKRDWASVSLSPIAEAYYRESFLPRYRALVNQVDQTPLAVLVWGPGASGGDLYQKRVQILGRLRQENVAAVFSEEIDQDAPVADCSTKARELLQAIAADLIIILQSSPGSIAEAHDFAGFVRDLGPKMLVFIDERARNGYAYSGALAELQALYSNVHTFEYPKDIDECNLLIMVLKRIRVMRHVKWRQEKVR